MIDGATNPPMTPNELIAAIPAADAAPDKKAAGIDQKGGVKASVAANAIVTAMILLVGSTSNAAAKSAAPARRLAMAAWPERSKRRSDRRPHQITAINANRLGIAATKPVCILLMPNPLRISGRKNKTEFSRQTLLK